MIVIPGRIPIAIHPFFWLLAAIIGWMNSGSFFGMLVWIGIIFFSVLIHEFGHALGLDDLYWHKRAEYFAPRYPTIMGKNRFWTPFYPAARDVTRVRKHLNASKLCERYLNSSATR